MCDYTDWRAWLVGAIISAWLQFQFWSRGHGACVDIGRDTIPSQDTIERYNEDGIIYLAIGYLIK